MNTLGGLHMAKWHTVSSTRQQVRGTWIHEYMGTWVHALARVCSISRAGLSVACHVLVWPPLTDLQFACGNTYGVRVVEESSVIGRLICILLYVICYQTFMHYRKEMLRTLGK